MTTDNNELLYCLPEPLINTRTKSGFNIKAYTAEQMREYAHMCVLKNIESCAELFDGMYTDSCPGIKISDAIRKRITRNSPARRRLATEWYACNDGLGPS